MAAVPSVPCRTYIFSTLVSRGRCHLDTVGASVFTLNMPCVYSLSETKMWSAVLSPVLGSKPRAGHSVIHLGCSVPVDAERHEQRKNGGIRFTLLVFGGSDCCGTFYNDSVKCTVEIPGDKWLFHCRSNPYRTVLFTILCFLCLKCLCVVIWSFLQFRIECTLLY